MTDKTFGWDKKLRKTDEFSSVFHFRCQRRGQVLDVSAGPNTSVYARLGLFVPKKVIATAVGSNRVKRLLREWFRQRQAEYLGMDIIARLKSKPRNPTELEANLQTDFLAGLAFCKECVNRKNSALNDI